MKTPPISPPGSICGAMLMKTFIEHLVGIEDVECAATYRAAVKGWQSGHYVAPGLAVIHDSRRRSELRLNADCGGYAIDTVAGHDVLEQIPVEFTYNLRA